MSEATLLVPTAFSDISQLAEGLTGRVESDRLMLYGPEEYEPGTTLHFSLTLHDGGVAFEGTGQVIESMDGGTERPEVARFDILLDRLEFAGSGQSVYEQILFELQEEGAGYGEPEEEEDVTVAAGADYVLDGYSLEDATHGVDDALEGSESSPSEIPHVQDEEFVEVAETGGSGEIRGDDGDERFDPAVAAAAEEPHSVEDDEVVAEAVESDWPASPPDETFRGARPTPDPSESAHIAAGPITEDLDLSFEAASDGLSVEAAIDGLDRDVPFGASDTADTADEVDISDAEGLDTRLYAEDDDGEDSMASALDEAPPMPPAPAGFDVQLGVSSERVLSRPGLEPTWQPVLTEAPSSRPPSGYFQFSGGLPAPAAPPRPGLDPGDRVAPAPRSGQQPTSLRIDEDSMRATSPPMEQADVAVPPNGSTDGLLYDEVFTSSSELTEDRDSADDRLYDPGSVDMDGASLPSPAVTDPDLEEASFEDVVGEADGDVETSFEDVAREVDETAWLDPDPTEAGHRET